MGPILMTEDGKKPGIEGAGDPDPLSATGMFLNAFQTQPDQPARQEQESAGDWFAAEDKTGAAAGGAKLGGAKLGGPWGQPLNAPSVPSSSPRPSLGEGKPIPGEFTQMFHKLEFAPAPPVRSAPEARPAPEVSGQEPGEFTRMFVRATASMPQRPMPSASDPAAFAPPATPRLKGFSTPGVSDSASAEGSFTQLFQSAAPAPAAPVRPFTPLSNGTEAAWPSNLDTPRGKDAMESAGVTQLFRALSPENEPSANRFGEQSPQPAVPASSAPGSITMLIQRLTEDLQSSPSPLPAGVPEPAKVSEPGEFTRIMSGGSASGAARQGGPAEKVAAPAPAVFPVPAVPLPVAPAFAAPAAPAIAVPKPQTPPIPAPQVVASADPPQSKLQQMMPMLLVLNAFLLVVLIVLVVFLLKAR
jgi:hypothetical protein